MSSCTDTAERRGVCVVGQPGRGAGELAIVALLSVPLRAGSLAMTRTTRIAVLTAARLSGQQVEMWFDNATGGSCNAAPWQPIKNMGWYWGSSIFP